MCSREKLPKDEATSKPSQRQRPGSSQLYVAPSVHKQHVPSSIGARLHQVLELHPDGILQSDLPLAYAEKFGELLNPREYGFISFGSLLRSVPQFVKIQRSGGSDARVFAAYTPINEECLPSIKMQIQKVCIAPVDNLLKLSLGTYLYLLSVLRQFQTFRMGSACHVSLIYSR